MPNDFQAKIKKEMAARRKVFKKQKMLPFVQELHTSLINGKTTASFRLRVYPFYPKPGERFKAHVNETEIEGEYLCKKRIKMTLKRVCDKHWAEVGVASLLAYKNLMKKILKTEDLNLESEGYLFIFERVA